jgi:hypothetical protein
MEIVKKFGLWAVAAVIAIGAIVVYFLFVNTVADQVGTKRGEIEKRRDDLKTWAEKAGKIPNRTKIDIAKKNGEQVAALLDQCELYLAQQPRRAHTRSFFIEGDLGPETEIPRDQPNNWLKEYQKRNQELQEQITLAGMPYAIQTIDFGGKPPPEEGIAAAMELYWFQKDLLDFLTQQVEKDFSAYLEFKARDRAEKFPAKPYDLVVNRSPGRLDEFLRSTSRDKLVAVLSAIVVNRQQQDLAMIFNTLLPDEKKADGSIVWGFPWERPASEKEHGSVRGFTMDEAQEKFLAEMLPPGKPDLTNRQRFLDFVMELRMVRYRADIVGLLESHHFDSLAASLRRGTDAELDGILKDIADPSGVWNTTRIAEAISAIASINTENDFRLVRNNHAPNIGALLTLTIGVSGESGISTGTAGARGMGGMGGPRGMPGGMDGPPVGLGGRPGGMDGPPVGLGGMPGGMGVSRGPTGPSAQAAGESDLYKLRTFNMQVKLEFERIPVFLRRLISNSWRYRVQIMDVLPTVMTTASNTNVSRPGGAPGGAMFPGMSPGGGAVMPGGGAVMPGGGAVMPAGGVRRQALPAGYGAPGAGRPSEPETVDAGNYVILTLNGEAYQFSPLLTKTRDKDKFENRATPAAPAPAPAGRPAPPTGAR